MDNIYLKEFKELEIDTYSSSIFSIREPFVTKYAWAIPDRQALQIIKDLKQNIVEMGAGTGYWARLLNDNGIDIIAYDCAPPQTDTVNDYGHKEKYFTIQQGEPKVLEDYSNRALFLCWPPYEHDMAETCLFHWKGEYLIYVGELAGGCTANDEFFQILEDKFTLIKEYEIPQWSCINDKLFIYQRKSEL